MAVRWKMTVGCCVWFLDVGTWAEKKEGEDGCETQIEREMEMEVKMGGELCMVFWIER